MSDTTDSAAPTRAAPAPHPPAQAPPAPSLIPSARTPRVARLSDQVVLLYGEPGIGKTTFAAQFPDALFFPTEPGLKHVEVYQVPPDGSGIRSWPQFLAAMSEVFRAVQAGTFRFRTLVIDTIGNLWDMVCESVAGKRQAETLGDISKGKGWILARFEFDRVLRHAAQLGLGLLLISHSRDREESTDQGMVVKAMPRLQKTAEDVLNPLADFILYCRSETVIGPDGKPTRVRAIRTKGSPAWVAKDRTGRLPDPILLDYDVFRRHYAAALNGSAPLVRAELPTPRDDGMSGGGPVTVSEPDSETQIQTQTTGEPT